MSRHDADVVVVGAGAAGLTAAIFAADRAGVDCRVLVLDSARKVGAKILVSGGGRCNVTHDSLSLDNYHGDRSVIRRVLRTFDHRAVTRWFETLGVSLKREETGKLFPTTDSAHTVLDALLSRCDGLGVTIRPNFRVSRIERDGQSFRISSDAETLTCQRVILATGGRSLPKSGSDGSGWSIAKKLGHAVTPTYAALVPLKLSDAMFHADVAGITHQAQLELWVGGKRIASRVGQILWTHFGLSGPCAMDVSRFWNTASTQQEAVLRCQFLPGKDFSEIEAWLLSETERDATRRLQAILAELLPKRVAKALCQWCGLDTQTTLSALTRIARRQLVHTLAGMELPVTGHRGWNFAEVTAGGIPLAEINPRTMESRIVPGLYLTGEMLDCDGHIGGFNFQWAWSTGFLAGQAAAI